MPTRWKSEGSGIYRDTRTGNLYHRPEINGRRTFRKLRASTLTLARREVAALKTRQSEAHLGIALDPYADLLTLGKIAKEWLARGAPDRKGRPRQGASLKDETAKLNRLLPFWKDRNARDITAEDCRDYHAWRIRRNKTAFRLGRSVDSELTTLSNILRWAAQNPRKTGLKHNPLATGRLRFDDRELTRHCTAVMPESDEVVHRLAAYFFNDKRSEPLGWQLLLEALTGGRTREILACRVDAHEGQSGFQNATYLHLNRLKKGILPWALLEAAPGHAPLAECLKAFRNWHRRRFGAKSPWFIPGVDPRKPMTRLALTNALERACEALEIKKVTSHGLRAYFVSTLRSLGIDDSEIAKRLGHRSGVGEVETTYGLSKPGWFNSRTQDFLPATGKPAWAGWLEVAERNIVPLAIYHPYTTIGKTPASGDHSNGNPDTAQTRANKGLSHN